MAEPSQEASGSSGIEPSQSPDPSAEEQRGLDPVRLMRIAGVTREVLEEVRRTPASQAGLAHLKEVHRRICDELEEALPPELYAELRDLTPEIKEGTIEELALGHAEILGWLGGLFQGTQLAFQIEAAKALQGARPRPGLPPGARPAVPGPGPDGGPIGEEDRPSGTYL